MLGVAAYVILPVPLTFGPYKRQPVDKVCPLHAVETFIEIQFLLYRFYFILSRAVCVACPCRNNKFFELEKGMCLTLSRALTSAL